MKKEAQDFGSLCPYHVYMPKKMCIMDINYSQGKPLGMCLILNIHSIVVLHISTQKESVNKRPFELYCNARTAKQQLLINGP